MKAKKILEDLTMRYPHLQDIACDIWAVYEKLAYVFSNNGRLYICGNGGSAADALHMAGELMKSFVLKRPVDLDFPEYLKISYPNEIEHISESLQGALPAFAMVENSALNSAFSNDVNAEMVFAQQAYGYMQKQDAILGISTSGNSKNVINALLVAKSKGAATIGLLGGTGGNMKGVCDLSIIVPETETYKIQELHLPVYHALCLMLEDRFFNNK